MAAIADTVNAMVSQRGKEKMNKEKEASCYPLTLSEALQSILSMRKGDTIIGVNFQAGVNI